MSRFRDEFFGLLVGWILGWLARTWRFESLGAEHVARLRVAGQPIVFLTWHGRLLPATYWHRHQSITLLVSWHRDGGYLAAAARRWGYHLVRGSTRRRGEVGLRGLVRTLQQGGDVAVTPDGPRGPAERVQPGAVVAAQRGGAPIVAVGASADRCWVLRSWDRFLIPKPFARVRVVYSSPTLIAPGAPQLEQGVAAVQQALDEVTAAA